MEIYDLDNVVTCKNKLEQMKSAIKVLKEACNIQFNISETDEKQFDHSYVHFIKDDIADIESKIKKLEKELERYKKNNTFDTNTDVNSNCVNSKIVANILTDSEMRKAGFTDNNKKYWSFMRQIKFPKNKRYKYFDISFNVSIPKDGSDISIDILDEHFGQPYDYQYMINNNPDFEPAWIVREQVEFWMNKLKESKIISGHKYGDYI